MVPNSPNTNPSAIAIKFEVPWEVANRKHQVRIELLDSDGNQVLIAGPQGPHPIGEMRTVWRCDLST